MISMIRRSIVLASLAAIGLLGGSARADLTLKVQEDSGAIQTFTIGGAPTGDLILSQGTVTTTDYSIKILGGEADQTSSDSQLLSSTVKITNTTGASGHVLHITVMGSGFTAPTAPPNTSVQVSSSLGGSYGPIGLTAGSLTFGTTVGGYILPSQSASFTTTGGTQSYTAGPSANQYIAPLTGTYMVTQKINITLNNLSDVANYSSNTTLTASDHPASITPEPSTMALAGLGALGMIGYCLRRRRSLGA